MNPILLYTLHVSMAFALFYSVYRVFLSHDTFFVRNRYYLLGSILVSLITPLLKFKIQVSDPAPELMYIPSHAYSTDQPVAIPVINYWQILGTTAMIIYLLGTGFYLIRFVWAYYKVIHLILISERKKLQDLILVITRLSLSPFSLLKWLVIPSHHLDQPDFENIVQHESIHSRQYHSVDLFLAELMVAVQWFNPFAWLLKKSMVENHEFIVDQVILQNGTDPRHYQYSLLNISTGLSQMAAVNYFNANLIKKRIRMMNKNKSPKWHVVKNLSIFITALAVVMLTASFEKVRVSKNATSLEKQSKSAAFENAPLSVIQSNTGNQNVYKQQQISSIEDLRMFLTTHLRYPAVGAQNPATVETQACFTIDKSGMITDITRGDKIGTTQRLKEIVVVAYAPEKTENSKSVQKLNDVKVTGYATSDDTRQLEGQKIVTSMFEEIKSCLKKLPVCHSSLTGVRYTIPVTFKIEDRPTTNIVKDTSRTIEIRNVNTNETFQIKKEGTLPSNVLYFLDGKKINSVESARINPDEIESINVLKDKTAILKYGEEGKDGVILITSKKGAAELKQQSPGSPGNELKNKNETLKEAEKEDPDSKKLYYLNGKKITFEEMKKIKTEDITKVEVLKGKSATILYGEDGKNGVVLFSTKAGTGN